MFEILIDSFSSKEELVVYKDRLELFLRESFYSPRLVASGRNLFLQTRYPFKTQLEFLAQANQMISSFYGEQIIDQWCEAIERTKN